MREQIINYIRAGYAGLYLISAEEQRVLAELKAIVEDIGFKLYAWSTSDGIVDCAKGRVKEANDPLEGLLHVEELPEKCVLVLKDFHLFLQDPNPILLRHFKDVLQVAKTKSKTLIVLGCRLCLPAELQRELTVIEFALPTTRELAQVLDGILTSAELPSLSEPEREAVLDAARGLTTIEAENAFALAIVEARCILPQIIAREKAQAVKKNGLLEIIESKECLENVGGLDVLKSWLVQRKEAFSQRARAYELPVPKGLLILGVPGTGKSLTAKASASVFGVPLLRLDASRLFGSLVGQSESNLRSAIQTAEGIAPCVLWIDEIEKGFSGSKSSGATDGGTSARVLGSFLNWMQDKEAPVFVVATANDVTQLPPEILRKGRFDELFFVDLPNQEERKAIWEIQIGSFARDPKEFDCAALAKATEGYTGSEIKQAFIDALYGAFDAHQEPTDFIIAKVLTEFVPLSQLMAEEITALRKWAKARARSASGRLEGQTLRRIAP
jgi:ATP-dependent 26S proteasome regulatory subunit